MAIDVRPVYGTHRGIWNARVLRTRERQIGDIGKNEIRPEFAQDVRFCGDPLLPRAMKFLVGGTTVSHRYIQCRRHQHAEIAVVWEMGKRYMDARAQMFGRNGRAHRDVQSRHPFVQRVQHRCSLGDMAETVGGDGNDEMGHADR